MSERIASEKFRQKVMSASEAAGLIKNGMSLGFSGFTGAGYPKEFPVALAEKIKEAHSRGEEFKVGVWTGASTAPELDGKLADAGGVSYRMPYQSDPSMRHAINAGEAYYQDVHLSHVAPQVAAGFFGPLDVAVIEVTAITSEGELVPSSSMGLNRTYLEHAQKVILEVNEWQSMDLFGMHDVYYPIGAAPGSRVPIPMTNAADRIGGHTMQVDPEKVIAVIITDASDRNTPFKPADEDSKKIAENFLDFLGNEVKQGRMGKNLLPLQSGVGNIANAVLAGLMEGPFENLQSYTEVIQDGMVDLLDSGKLSIASATAFSLSPDAAKKVNDQAKKYRDLIILRPQDVSNHPEVIRRLGVVACNGMIEADIYGNVNSTHVMGSRIQNGIGGSGDFTRNSSIAAFVTPSTAKGGAISCIVPFVNHVDHTEHDTDVVITEQGLADLRGLAPRRRAEVIIENCAHPDYKEPLREYVARAQKLANGQHTPHDLATAFSWHTKFLNEGTMR